MIKKMLLTTLLMVIIQVYNLGEAFRSRKKNGFFVDINLFKGSKQSNDEAVKILSDPNSSNVSDDASGVDSLADEDANLMVKLKFLTYKLRTFLIRNDLSVLFKDGPAAYKANYLSR